MLPLWLAVFLLGIHVNIKAEDNVYQVTQQSIETVIDAKGVAHVSYNFTVKADYLNRLEIKLPTGEQKLSFYRVGLVDKEQSLKYFAESNSQVAGSFQLLQNSQEASIVITYPVTHTTVQFQIEYDLNNAVVNYQDGAFFEASWLPLLESDQESNQDIKLMLSFAGRLEEEVVDYWLQGVKLNQFQHQIQEGKTHLIMDLTRSLNEKMPISLHAFFPKSVTPNNTNVIEINGRQSILNKESAIQKKIDEGVRRENYQLLIRILMTLGLPFLGTGILYNHYKRSKKVERQTVTDNLTVGKLPENLDPCLVNAVVYHKEPGPNELASSILELGRKGYLKMLPIRMAKRSNSQVRSGFTLVFHLVEDSPSQALLPSYERYALQLIRLNMNSKQVITLEEILLKIRQRKQSKKAYQELWKKYIEAIKMKSVSLSQPQNKQSKYWLIFNLLLIVTTLSLAFIISSDMVNQDLSKWLIWLAIVVGGYVIIQCFMLYLLIKQFFLHKKLSPQQLLWNSFKKHLRIINQYPLKQYGNVSHWEKLLIYAVCLNETATIQQAFTHYFDMIDLEKNSRSQNADFYRVHGSVANILQPAVKEWIELINPKGKWLRRFLKAD